MRPLTNIIASLVLVASCKSHDAAVDAGAIETGPPLRRVRR